jgi:hypothetical protein
MGPMIIHPLQIKGGDTMSQKQWQHFSTSELNSQSTKELSWLEFGTSKKCECDSCSKGGECESDRKTHT